MKMLRYIPVLILLLSSVFAAEGTNPNGKLSGLITVVNTSTSTASVAVRVAGLSESQVKMSGHPVFGYTDEFLSIRNGSDVIDISENGEFVLSSGLQNGQTYEVEIANQPYLGTQTCQISGSASGIVTAETSFVDVNCGPSPIYRISGQLTGLADGGVTVANNAGEEKNLTSDGPFQFDATEYLAGNGFSVHVVRNPVDQICTIRGDHGIAGDSAGSAIQINCVDRGVDPRASICVSNREELQDALSEAADNGIDTTILLVEGLYSGPLNFSSEDGSAITLEGGHTANCDGPVSRPENTVLDGNGLFRVLSLKSTGSVTIRHVTIQNGFSQRYEGDEETGFRISFGGFGGGVEATIFGDRALTIESSIIQDNIAHTDGGGGRLFLTDGVIRLTNNIFRNNLACPLCPIKLLVTIDGQVLESGFGPSGGGMWFNIFDGRADVVNNTFYRNIALSGFGGGVRISMNPRGRESFSRLVNNIFFENLAADEGNDVWMQFDEGPDFTPQFPPVLTNNRFDPREPQGVFADFEFDFNFSENPRFVGSEQGDLRLADESPLVDGGLTPAPAGADQQALAYPAESPSRLAKALPDGVTLPQTDIAGNPRINGPAVDVGAFENDLIFSDDFRAAVTP